MKNVLLMLCTLSCGAFAQMANPEICPVHSKDGGLYLMPRGENLARVIKGTQVVLVLSSGETKMCLLGHDVYPYIEEVEGGRYIATDLRTGQKVFRSNGEPFEVIMTPANK
jgi:hypothetical protein